MSSFLRTLKHAATAATDALGLSSSASSTVAVKRKKPACPYGAKCYRKNPQHRIDESHPGDEDDEEDELAAADEPAPPPPQQPAPARRANSRRGAAVAAAEDESPQPVAKKASSARRGAAASDPADATVAAAASPASTVAASSVSSAALPSSPTSPRVADKKMSVRDRRRKQKEEEEAASASMSPTPPSDLTPPSFDRMDSAAARAAPATLPPIKVDSVASFATDSASSAPLLASLHCLFASDLIPLFTEIRQGADSATAADGNSGAFFIGRVSAPGASLKSADGTVVDKVHLQLNSRNPQLAKMISRVHASIRWERTPIVSSADDATARRAGTKGLITKRGAAATADTEQAYSYRWFLHDESSINGVFLNNTKLPSRGRTELHPSPSGDGDRLAFGGGMGLEAGTFLKQDPQAVEFVFKFNAVTRLPTLPAENGKGKKAGAKAKQESIAEEEEESDAAAAAPEEEEERKQPHASAAAAASVKSRSAGASLTGVRKRVTPTASPLKRHRSDDPRRGKHATEHDADDAAAADDAPPAASTTLGRRRSSTHSRASDASSDAGVAHAGDTESATQNFGSDSMLDDAHDHDHSGGATQDFTDHDREAVRAEAQAGSTQDFGDAIHASLGGEATQDAGGELL